MYIAQIDSFEFELKHIGACLGAFVMDFLRWLAMSIIYWAYEICVGIQKIVNYLLTDSIINEFFGGELVSKYYQFSILIGVLFLLLFASWQILKRNLEPDKSPPLSSILWETGKCAILIFMFSSIFVTVFNLSLALQHDLIKVSTDSEDDVSFAQKIIVTTVESNYPDVISTEDLQDYVERSLNTDITASTCDKNFKGVTIYASDSGYSLYGSDHLRFWGCDANNIAPFYNFRTASFDSYNDYKDKLTKGYGISKDSSLFKTAENMTPSAILDTNSGGYVVDSYDRTHVGLAWIDAATRTQSSYEGGYIMDVHILYMFIGLVGFTIAMVAVAITLCNRIFELVILFVLAPAVIGSSICRQETRSNLWKLLASNMLQAVGIVLTLYLGIYFMDVICDLNTVSSLGTIGSLVLRIILIIADALLMVQGSKIIQTFISDSAGLGKNGGLMGALALGAGVFGAAKGFGTLGKKSAGLLAKTPRGIANAGQTIGTKIAEGKVNKALKTLNKAPNGTKGQYKAWKAYEAAKNNLKDKIAKNLNSSIGTNSKGELKRGFMNNLSSIGDKLLGHEPSKVESKQDSRLRKYEQKYGWEITRDEDGNGNYKIENRKRK